MDALGLNFRAVAAAAVCALVSATLETDLT